MAVNKSTSKIRVTKLFGAGAEVGLKDPAVNMLCRYGTEKRWIVATDSGNYHCSLALTSGGAVMAKAYPHDLVIDTPTASGFGWPSSSDSVVFGHHGVFPNGIPNAIGSGMVYEGGDSTEHMFSRLPNPS